jgi:amino acid adenylation domain-containing protein
VSSLSQLLFDKRKTYAALEALRVRERSITYEELNARALTIAAALVARGAERETIAIVGQRKAASYLGILGTLYAGCSYTPINPKYSRTRISQTLADAKIRFGIGSREDLELVAPILASGGAPRLEAVILPEGNVPASSGWLGEEYLQRITPLETPVVVQPEDLAYVLYTSGSTGAPKGVQVMHSNVLAFLRNMAAIYNLEPGFRASQTFDLSFDPSVSDIFFTWAEGGALCVLPEEEILLPSEYIRREKISFLNLVPSIGEFMRKMGALAPGSFPDLRYTMFCGEQFPKRLADAWRLAAPGSTIENLYGPTEATIYISRHVYSPDQQERRFRNSVIPIGQPFAGHEVALVDEGGVRVPNGKVGEIVFKGPQVTKGYLNDRGKTDSVFVTFDWDATGNRWYRTGDLGVFNEYGDLECLGRRDNQVKLAGRRIELGEIEAALSVYPVLADVVVVPIRDESQAVSGLVAFTTRAVSREEEARIRSDSTGNIERIFFPKRIITIASFPLTASGKTDRKALEAVALSAMAPGASAF